MNLDVVIVTYQSAEHLPACLDSLPGDARTVVVDNASTDASAVIAEARGAVVVRNTANLGFAAAANQGAALGDAELLLFLNPDARIAADDLSRLVGALRSDPSAAVAGPRLVHPGGIDQRPWWPFPSAHRSWLEAVGLYRILPHRRRHHVPFVVGACFLVRRSVFEALGGFDEAFWLYGEEADLCRRAATAGWRVRYVPDAVVAHAGGASAEAAGREFVSEHFLLGTDRFIAKHDGRAALVSHRLALLIGSAIRAVVLAPRPGNPVGAHRRRLVRRQLRVLARSPASLPAPPQHDRRPCGDVVVCSLEAWDDTWRRNQFLVRELMARDPGLRVLFVEPAADVPHELIRARRLPGGLGLRQVSPDGRLWALRPRKLLPRAIGPWADRSLLKQVRAAAATLGMGRPTLWVNDSTCAPLLEETGWPALYDVTDDWLEAASSPRERRRRQEREGAMLRRSGVVTVCSPALARSRGAHRPVVVIPNAVDAAHFTRPRPRPADLPSGRCAVYVGTLQEERLDVDLVVDLARSIAGSVVLVGPDVLSERPHASLAAVPNVQILGARPYQDIPAYLQYADVVIVPHVVSPFTESLDPIKAYEILAVGRPAVATRVAGLRDLGPPVQCVDRRRFVATVQSVLADPPAPEPQMVPSWAERAERFEVELGHARIAEPRLSVVYVDHCARISGGEIALLRLIPALRGSVSAHVILAEDGPLRERLEAAGISSEVLPMAEQARDVKRAEVSPSRLPVRTVVETLAYVLRLRRRLRQLQPDLVHTNSLKAGIYGSLAARLAGVPVIWHVRDRIDTDYLPPFAVALVRALVRHLPNAAIANSQATLETLGPMANKIVVYNVVVYDVVADTAVHAPRLWEYGFLVGMVGRISPWKGQDVFLRAFADAFGTGDERAVIVGGALFGEEDYEAKLHELAKDLGVEDRVHFTGFRADVDELLHSFDVLVHASVIPEPFGQVVVEAMVAGVPVIATAAGGPVEIIEGYECGLLYPPGDVAALSGLLRRVRDDSTLRARLSAKGRERIRDFAPEVVAPQMLALYRALLTPASRHRRRGSRGVPRIIDSQQEAPHQVGL